MNYEESRLRTFKNWPSNAGVDARKIAKAGFYYVGQGLEVQCFSCGGRISEWNYEDRGVAVVTRHKSLDPGCPFIRNPELSGNVPLVNGVRSPPADSRSTPNQNRRDSGSTSVTQENYQNEVKRFESFSKWPVSFIAKDRLVKAGFYYTGELDRVQCAFCDGIVEGWEPGDEPLEEHRKHFPKCTYLNKVLNSSAIFTSGIHVRDSTSNFNEGDGDYEELKWLGVQSHRIPRNPKYSTYEARLASFRYWPPSIPQTAEQLADSGFYFTGRGDQVRCFHCDGGLRMWEKSDVPWQEHARWFSECGFVFLVKGQQFIDETLTSVKPIPVIKNSSPSSREVQSVASRACAKVRTVSEQELQAIMHSPQAMAALEVGLDPYRVKLALKNKMEQTGLPFSTAEALIGATVLFQNQEDPPEDDDTWSTPPLSPVLLRRVIPRRSASRSRSRSRSHSPSPPPSPTFTSCDSSSNPFKLSENTVFKEVCSPDLSPSSEKSRGEEEVRRLREWRQCKVCMDREVSVVFLPCGHLVTCAHCAHSLADCPLCRQVILATVRTFLS